MICLSLDLIRQKNPLYKIKNLIKSKFLQTCKLIILDEANMKHKRTLEAFEQTLKDLENNTKIMEEGN